MGLASESVSIPPVFFASRACVARLIRISRSTLSGSISSASTRLKMRMANKSLAPSVNVHFGPATPTRGRRRVFFCRCFFVLATEDSRFGAAENGVFRGTFVAADLPDFDDDWLILCDVLRAWDARFAAADLTSDEGANPSGERRINPGRDSFL